MKKITFIFSLILFQIGLSQNLLTNGDFENGFTNWSGNLAGNPANIVTSVSNSYFSFNVTVAGNPWDQNLSYVLDIPNAGVNYKLTFDAWSNTNRVMTAGIGLNQAPWTNVNEEVNLTPTQQTFELNFTSNFGDPSSRVIFDMGHATGFVNIDNVILEIVPDQLPLVIDFETASEFTFAGFEGLGGIAVVADPSSGGSNGQGLQLTNSSSGQPWQGGEIVLTSKKVNLTSNKTMTIDVYSTQAFNLLAKVEVGGPASATAQSYTTPGEWQTLTFDFTIPMDNTTEANGEYEKVVFFGGWNSTNNGFAAPSNFAYHIDNIRAEFTQPTVQLDLLLGFETSESGGVNGGPFGNGVAPVVQAGTGSNTSQVLRIEGNPAGEVWQGINLNLTESADLTSSQTMSIDVLSSTPIYFLVKVLEGGPTAAASVYHNGDGTWQTIEFTFNTSLDGQAAMANGIYSKFVIHTFWANNATTFGQVATDSRVFYVDNIRGPQGSVAPDPAPDGPAPLPPFPNSEVYSIYNDTNGYTNNFPVAYDFGHLSGEPDLDPSANVNKAYKFNFGIAGWGQGEAMANLSAYNFVSFDYWAQPGLPNGFRFVMISNNGGVTEHVYQIGTQEPLVTGEWKKVEIPLTYFTGLGFANTHFFQWKVSPFNDSVDNAGFVYVDNILITQTSILSNDRFDAVSLKMYPNPAQDMIYFSADKAVSNVRVYNIVGQEVLVRNNEVSEINISNLNSGVYVIKAITDGVEVTEKFIKK